MDQKEKNQLLFNLLQYHDLDIKELIDLISYKEVDRLIEALTNNEKD